MKYDMWGVEKPIKKEDITNKSDEELFLLVWNDRELNPLMRDIDLIRKAVNYRYVYSNAQWKRMFVELNLYLNHSKI